VIKKNAPQVIMAVSALAASFAFPTEGLAAKQPPSLCVISLDVSASNSKDAKGVEPGASIAATRSREVDEGKLADVGKILDACSRRKSVVDVWAIDRNPRALRGPIVSADFNKPKDDKRSDDDFLFARRSAVLCVIRGVVNIALTTKTNSTTTTPNPDVNARVKSCPIRSDVSYDPQGTDIFGALDRVRIYLAQADPKARKSLYILTDGLNTSFDINFYEADLADPAVQRSILAKAKLLGFVKPFGPVDGCMKGLGAQANGEVDVAALKGLNELWTTYFKAVAPPASANFSVTDTECWNERKK
jgi:hypothetical protein